MSDGSVASNRFSHHRAILGAVPHFVLVVDSNGVILDVSDEVTKWMGWDGPRFIGSSVFDFVHPGDHPRVVLELLRELTEPLQPAPSMVIRAKKSDGTWCDVEILGKDRVDDPEIGGVLVAVRYVSGPSLSQRVLAAGDYLYQSVATQASDGTTIFDPSGKRVYTSSSLVAMLGYSAEELQELGPRALMVAEDLPLWKDATTRALTSDEGVARVECRVQKKNGESLWIEATVVNLLGESGVTGVVVHVRDINDRRSLQLELTRRASVDELTGLANRSVFVERMNAMYEQREPRTVLFCDLDGFKSVNDKFGHSQGDRLLSEVGHALRSSFGPNVMVARIGGDEFCLLRSAIDDVAASCMADQIVAAVGSVADRVLLSLANHTNLRMGVSIGIATDVAAPGVQHGGADKHADIASSLLSRADHAMYASKRRGRNLATFG